MMCRVLPRLFKSRAESIIHTTILLIYFTKKCKKMIDGFMLSTVKIIYTTKDYHDAEMAFDVPWWW